MWDMVFDGLEILLICFQFLFTVCLCILSTMYCAKCCCKETKDIQEEEPVSVSAMSEESWLKRGERGRDTSRSRGTSRTSGREVTAEEMMNFIEAQKNSKDQLEPITMSPEQYRLLMKMQRRSGKRGKCDHSADANWQPAVKMEEDVATQDTLYYVETIPEDN